MQFSKNSGLVRIWISLIRAGIYTLEQVPSLFNFKEVVTEILETV